MSERLPQDGVLDHAWFAAWVASGLRELERYLRNHAAFDAYCRQRSERTA